MRNTSRRSFLQQSAMLTAASLARPHSASGLTVSRAPGPSILDQVGSPDYSLEIRTTPVEVAKGKFQIGRAHV